MILKNNLNFYKKIMNLHIHIWTNLEYFNILNEWYLLSTWKQDKDIASFFVKNFPGEFATTISPQYEINFLTIRELKKHFWNDVFNKINWIYYWSDNCEYLTPSLEETQLALKYFKEFNQKYPPHIIRSFTFVTPYVWDIMLKKLEQSLEYLNNLKIKNPIEIVVNDYWVLNLLINKYKNLTPIFWRLLIKLLKTPLVDTYWYDVHPPWEFIKNKSSQKIEEMKKEIIKWQLSFYNSCEVSLDEYKHFLDDLWIKRITLDFLEKRENLYSFEKYDNIWVDIYYPWSLVFTWRLCDTSAIEDPARWYYAIDKICPRTCNKYDIFYKLKTVWYNLIQRWNAWYKSQINLDYLPKDFLNKSQNRFIFSPFIPV